MQSAAAQVERHPAALGPLHEPPSHWLTPQQHHDAPYPDGYYLPDQYASTYPGSQAFAETEMGSGMSGAAGHPLVHQMGQYQAGPAAGSWVQGPGAAAPWGYADDGLMGFQYQQQ